MNRVSRLPPESPLSNQAIDLPLVNHELALRQLDRFSGRACFQRAIDKHLRRPFDQLGFLLGGGTFSGDFDMARALVQEFFFSKDLMLHRHD